MLSYLLGTFFVVFMWEHFGTLKFISASSTPSFFIGRLANFISNLYANLGKLFAILSSFILWLKLELFVTTLRNLCYSIFQLLIAPLSTFKGYAEQVYTYVSSMDKFYVMVGSCFIFEFLWYGLLYIQLISHNVWTIGSAINFGTVIFSYNYFESTTTETRESNTLQDNKRKTRAYN